MFQGFTDETFEFFMAIRFNNNVDFFHDNHDWYLRAVREPCLGLAAALSDGIGAIDDDLERRPNRVVSRINRDIRFSHDKSPYRDYLWLSFHRPRERADHREPRFLMPGFYFEISARGASLGMGCYDENRPLMNGLRRRLAEEPEAFLKTLRPLEDDYRQHLFTFKRMKPPEGLLPQAAEWYPVRSFYLEREIDDFRLLKSPELADFIAGEYRRLEPLYRYIVSIPPESDPNDTRTETKPPLGDFMPEGR